MKYPIKDIVNFIEKWAKDEYQLSWDNSGKQIFFNEMTDSVIIGMDLTDKLINEAITEDSRLIITHHPLFFSGLKNIIEGSYKGDNIINLINNRISVLSSHTSLDIAEGGVNDSLFNKLLLTDREVLTYDEDKPIGLVGTLSRQMSFEEFKDFLKQELDINNFKIYGKPNSKKIRKVALMGGSGAEFIDCASNCADIYLTGDVKYHDGQRAYENNFIVVDLGHFDSEKFVLEEIKNRLIENFPKLIVKVSNISTFELD